MHREHIGRMQFRQALLLSRMADGVLLEFQCQQHSRMVFHDALQVERQNPDPLFRGRGIAQVQAYLLPVASQVLLENRKEDVFFILEIRVKRPAGLSCRRGNVFHPRQFKPIAGKDPACGIGQMLSGRNGAVLLLGSRRSRGHQLTTLF